MREAGKKNHGSAEVGVARNSAVLPTRVFAYSAACSERAFAPDNALPEIEW